MIDKNDGGWLCTLANQGNLEKVKELIEQGINVDAIGCNGETALEQASMAGRLDVVRYLVDIGANVNVKARNNGRTPLWYACDCGHLDVVRFLLDHGANINPSKEPYRESPLCKSLNRNQYHIARELIERGADVNAGENDYEIPLLIAKRKGNTDIVSLLIEHGAVDTSTATANSTVSKPVLKSKDSTTPNTLNFFKRLFSKK